MNGYKLLLLIMGTIWLVQLLVGCHESSETSTTSGTTTDFSVPLKTLALERGIGFGAMYQYDLRGERYDQIFKTEMNTMTAGIFWTDGSRETRTDFDFSEFDAKVTWGIERNMEVHGHILVWFDDIPDWLKSMPANNIEDIMNKHIDTVVSRYANQIKVWDVVNEAVDEDGALRQGHKWVEAMGNDYIRKAFVRAHAAAPNVVLRYNDYLYNNYFIENNKKKFEGIKALLVDLKNQGAPVHALGWQMHVTPTSFDAAMFLAHLNEIADLGFDNYITELDVELPDNAGASDYEQQKQTYKAIVETFLAPHTATKPSSFGGCETETPTGSRIIIRCSSTKISKRSLHTSASKKPYPHLNFVLGKLKET